jgi:hypothetical protein
LQQLDLATLRVCYWCGVIRRRQEIAVRLALGANGAAVLRQSLLEAMLLSVAGGLLDLAFAGTALRVGVSFLPESLPRVSSIGPAWRLFPSRLESPSSPALCAVCCPPTQPRAPA